MLIHGVKTAFDATDFVARHIADLIPLLLNGGKCLTRLLGGLLILDRNKGFGLDQQFLLLGQVLLFGGADLVTVRLTCVEEGVGGGTELGPHGIILAASRTAGLLPTIHQLAELA